MKKFYAIILLVFVILLSTAYAANFSDLSNDHWAYEPIIEMANQGILTGYPDGTFLPDKSITRAEFAKILVLALDLKSDGTKVEFEDVPESHWAYSYIQTASKYLSAYRNEDNSLKYMPDEKAGREDVAVAIVVASNLENAKYDLNTLNRLTDKDDISEGLRKYVAIAVENGLMRGHDDGSFEPKGYLTRAQISQLVKNTKVRKEKVVIKDEEKKEEEKPTEEAKNETTKTMKAVPTGQVKEFSKKLKNGENFEIQVNKNTVNGNMWKDGALFELYPIHDGQEFTDQFVIKGTDSWTTMYGAKEDAKLYGFTLEELENDAVRFTYTLKGITYFAESPVENTHVKTDTLQNFICFILNNDKNVKLAIEQQVPDRQAKAFVKKLKAGENFVLMINKMPIEGKMWKDGSLFELYPDYDGEKFTEQFSLNDKDSWTTMYGAKKSAELFDFNLEEIEGSKVKFSYKLNGTIYYAISEIKDTHVKTDILQNFICFVLNNNPNVKVVIEKEVPTGQTKQFVKKLKAGENFKIQIGKETITGNYWKDGSLFELNPVFGNQQVSDQFTVKDDEDNWITMYGAKEYASLFGFDLEETNNSVKFIYELNGTTYYATSEVENTHVKADILKNFICFVINNDKNIKIIIEKAVPTGQVKQFAKKLKAGEDFKLQIDKEVITGNMWKDGTLFELYSDMNGQKLTDQFSLQADDDDWTTMAGAKHYASLFGFDLEEIDKNKVQFSYTVSGVSYYATSEVESTHVKTDVLQNMICFVINNNKNIKLIIEKTVPTGQVKQFAKKLKAGENFIIKIDKETITGNMWKDGTLFEMNSLMDGHELTDQFSLQPDDDDWTTMAGAKHYASLFGFNLEEIGNNKVKYTYTISGVSYYVTSEVENTHVKTDILQNMTCFVLNNSKNVKVIIEKAVPTGQVKQFAKKLKAGTDFTIQINGETITGNMWKDGTLFEINTMMSGVEITDQFSLQEDDDNWATMAGAKHYADLFGFDYEEIDKNTIKFTYELNGIMYYAVSEISKTHVKADVLQNMICFVLNNNKTVKIS